MSAGLTAAGYYGVMDGWDVAAMNWKDGLFRGHSHEPGYAEGYELGAACFRLVGPRR